VYIAFPPHFGWGRGITGSRSNDDDDDDDDDDQCFHCGFREVPSKKMKNKVIQEAWNNNFTQNNFYNFTIIRENSLSNEFDS